MHLLMVWGPISIQVEVLYTMYIPVRVRVVFVCLIDSELVAYFWRLQV